MSDGNLTGSFFILRPISINVSIRLCFNFKHRLVVRFCENSVFGVRLATLFSYALHIFGTRKEYLDGACIKIQTKLGKYRGKPAE
jgi:hypothetical protein